MRWFHFMEFVKRVWFLKRMIFEEIYIAMA
jgi:hypothetical protein